MVLTISYSSLSQSSSDSFRVLVILWWALLPTQLSQLSSQPKERSMLVFVRRQLVSDYSLDPSLVKLSTLVLGILVPSMPCPVFSQSPWLLYLFLSPIESINIKPNSPVNKCSNQEKRDPQCKLCPFTRLPKETVLTLSDWPRNPKDTAEEVQF